MRHQNETCWAAANKISIAAGRYLTLQTALEAQASLVSRHNLWLAIEFLAGLISDGLKVVRPFFMNAMRRDPCANHSYLRVETQSVPDTNRDR
jgi:hypothetical protein